ncbi:hypothetical protein SBADM41S_00831 [Streptomyces badius]
MPYSAERAAAKCELFQPRTTKEMTPTRGASSPNSESTRTSGTSASPSRTRDTNSCSRATRLSKPASVRALQAEAME